MSREHYIMPDWPAKDSRESHDWRKYVSNDVRKIWSDFTTDQRVALGECFDEIASREEWE